MCVEYAVESTDRTIAVGIPILNRLSSFISGLVRRRRLFWTPSQRRMGEWRRREWHGNIQIYRCVVYYTNWIIIRPLMIVHNELASSQTREMRNNPNTHGSSNEFTALSSFADIPHSIQLPNVRLLSLGYDLPATESSLLGADISTKAINTHTHGPNISHSNWNYNNFFLFAHLASIIYIWFGNVAFALWEMWDFYYIFFLFHVFVRNKLYYWIHTDMKYAVSVGSFSFFLSRSPQKSARFSVKNKKNTTKNENVWMKFAQKTRNRRKWRETWMKWHVFAFAHT